MATALTARTGSRIRQSGSSIVQSEQSETSSPSLTQTFRSWSSIFLLPLAVMALGAILGYGLWCRYLPENRLLWGNVIHDRQAHLHSGLTTALDLRHGRWLGVLSDIDKCRTWPPLHDSFMLGATLVSAGGDVRYAVWPSLLGWMGCAVFAFLIARRLCGPGGNVAGIVAALFVLVSPAFKAYATDVMLESMGALLTLACVYFAVCVRQSPNVWACRGLGISLTALFFTKYNYWLLVVIGLLAEQFLSSSGWYLSWFGATWTALRRSGWLREKLMHPVLVLAGLVLALLVAIQVSGVHQWTIGGHAISVRSPANLLTAAYLLVLIRVVLGYRREVGTIEAMLGTAGKAIVRWHAWPVALWFLWPQRVYSFLWYSNPSSNAGERPQFDLFGGYPFYWSCLTEDYMVGGGIAVATFALFALTVAAWLNGRLRPGVGILLCVTVIALVLTVHHPNRKSRFLHSWVAIGWVTAAVGVGWLTRPRRGLLGAAAKGGAIVAIGTLAFWSLPELVAAPHAPEGGIPPHGPDALQITDAYLPLLNSSKQTTVLSNLPVKWMVRWTFLERFDHSIHLETDIPFFEGAGPESKYRFDSWLRSTSSDSIVYLDFAPTGPLFAAVPGLENFQEMGVWLRNQTSFAIEREIVLPQEGCTVTVWRRRD